MAEEDVDYYALLGVTQEATLQQIKTAYRKESLKVHPDRNPDNPDAAHLFHQLNSAFNLLSSPQDRATFDAALSSRNAKKARFAALDNKRKVMAQDLEERERAFKRNRGEQERERGRKLGEVERLREEGRRLREEGRRLREERAKKTAQMEEEVKAHEPEAVKKEGLTRTANGADELGPLDKTLKVKWSRSLHPQVESSNTLSTLLASLVSSSSTPSTSSDIGIDSIVLSSKTLSLLARLTPPPPPTLSTTKKKKEQKCTGVVSFRSLSAAVKVMKARLGAEAEQAGEGRAGRWEGVEVEWAAGEAPDCVRGEVEKLTRNLVSANGRGGSRPEPFRASGSAPPPSFASAPALPAPSSASTAAPVSTVPASEESILSALRARERERERLMEEMRKQDEEEEQAGQA